MAQISLSAGKFLVREIHVLYLGIQRHSKRKNRKITPQLKALFQVFSPLPQL